MNKEEITYTDLYNSKFDSICRYCMSHLRWDKPTSEDITSEAFVELFRKWDELDSHTEAGLMTWLTRAAMLKIKAYLRKSGKEPDMESYDDDKEYPHTEDNENVNDEKVYSDYIKLIKDTLSEIDWQIFEYRYIKQYDFDRIAAICGSDKNTLYVKWFRIRQKLKKVFKKKL